MTDKYIGNPEQDVDESCKEYESGCYWIDPEHYFKIWLTPQLVEKYKDRIDDLVPKEEELEERLDEWGPGEDYDELVKDLAKYSHYIFIEPCTHFTVKREDYDKTDKWIDNTVHGAINSNELLAWINGFPEELLNEPGVIVE